MEIKSLVTLNMILLKSGYAPSPPNSFEFVCFVTFRKMWQLFSFINIVREGREGSVYMPVSAKSVYFHL